MENLAIYLLRHIEWVVTSRDDDLSTADDT